MKRVTRRYDRSEAVGLILNETEKRVRRLHAAPVFVGISGIDCSGKTTLATALRSEVADSGLIVSLVNVDDFIIPGALRKFDGPPDINYFENTFDHDAFIEKVEQSAGAVQVLIAEGVLIFRKEMADRWDLKVWMEMSEELSMERGAVRDADYFGSAEQALAEYQRRFIPAHRYHVQRDRPQDTADFVFEVD